MERLFNVPGSVEEIIDFMNNKYGEDFSLIKPVSISLVNRLRSVFLHSDKYPELPVFVIYRNVGGVEEYQDGYLHVKYSNEIKQSVNDIIDKVFGENNRFVFYMPSNYDTTSKFDNETPFYQFANDEDVYISVDTVVFCNLNSLNIDLIKDSLECEVNKAGFRLELTVRVLDELLLPVDINNGNFVKFIITNESKYLLTSTSC